MTFYIPQFWCGVITTVVFEISMIIGAAIISSINKDKKKGDKDAEKEVDALIGTYDDHGQ